MPRITAVPNPVGVYSAGTPGWTNINFNTESATISGIVFASENGGDEEPLKGQRAGGIPRGDVRLYVNLGSTYRVSLKRADDVTVELASTIVTTFDLRQQLAAGFSAAYQPQLRPQIISNVVVHAGIDTVRISFRTTRPTIPTTEIRDDQGNYVDGRMPLFGGLRTRHQAVFGFERPLALNRKHSFRIEAFGPTNDPASPNKAVATGEFITGRRHIDVMFETLDMHDDGDSSGAGEFRIKFAVGDVETRAQLGNYAIIRGDISDSDPPIDLGKTLSLTDAPRQLWLQVLAHENDHEIGILHLMGDGYMGPGGKYTDDGVEEIVRLTIDVDVDTDPGRWMIPFELRTGDWPVDFVVTGHLGVHAFEGSVISPKIAKLAPPSNSSTFLTEPGAVAAIGGADERTELVAIAADGALYHRSIRQELPARRSEGDWTRVDLPGRGTPAVVASAAGSLDLFDLNGDGGILHCRYDAAKRKATRWRRLGGQFRHVVPVVAHGKGRGAEPSISLFGIAEDGTLHVRDAAAEGREWDRIGDGPVRAVAPVSAPAAALFAVGEDGTLFHFARRNGRWRAQALDGRVPGEAGTQLLTVAVMDQADAKSGEVTRDLVIGAMGEDRRVRTLRWPGYPSGAPERRWQDLGTVQDLLVEQAPKRPAGTRKAAGAGAKAPAKTPARRRSVRA